MYLQTDVHSVRTNETKLSKGGAFADMEQSGTSTILSCIFNLLRDYGCTVGLANQSCVRGSLCLDSTVLRCVARTITLFFCFSLAHSVRISFNIIRDCNDYTGSTFSRPSSILFLTGL